MLYARWHQRLVAAAGGPPGCGSSDLGAHRGGHGSPAWFAPNPKAMSTIGRSQVVPVAVGGLVCVVQTEGVALSAGLDDM